MNLIIILSLSLAIATLLFVLFRKFRQVNYYRVKYKDVINIDKVLTEKNEEIKLAVAKVIDLNANFETQKRAFTAEYTAKRTVYEGLLKEISILEENLENISYGLYKPHYNYDTSDKYKQRLDQLWEREKTLIKEGEATYCPIEWQVGGSKREGAKMIKHNSKLMLRAFNGECSSAIAKVKWNNIGNMESRIQKAYEAINRLGETQRISITSEYYHVKLEELRLEFELQEKLYQEKEEQKQIRAQMREEELALREIEKAQKEAEDEEKRYQKALEKARADLQNATGQKLDELNGKIQELEMSLKQAQEEKQRAISRAQLTKSGHIYIISNIGSFGDNVYKIGMTRRLEPLDRVHELGDASVPFAFDVHALVYSENAPELENTFHRKLEDKRVNLVNQRREFFNVSLEDIEKIANELKLEIQLTKIAEAKEYRESTAIKAAKEKPVESLPGLERFPVSL